MTKSVGEMKMNDMEAKEIIVDAKQYYDMQHSLFEYDRHNEKYRWHDLRKDPGDIPSDDYNVGEWYECVLENHIYDPEYPSFQFDGVNFGYRNDIFDPVTYGYVDSEFKAVADMGYEKVIAWRLVELFEED